MSNAPAQDGMNRRPPATSAQAEETHSVLAHARRHARPILTIVIGGIILIGAVIALTSSLLSNMRDRVLANQERTLANLATMLSEQLDRSFQSIDLIHTVVIDRIQAKGIASTDDLVKEVAGYDTHQHLNDLISGLPYIDAIVLTDTEGRLINFTRTWPIPVVNNTEQDYTVAFANDPLLQSYIGKPRRSPTTGQWIIQIARKIVDSNGKFIGVILGTVQLTYLENLFASIAPGGGSIITLQHGDGTMLVRYPQMESAIGRRLTAGMKSFDQHEHAITRYVAATDGRERILATHRLAHFPLFAAVGIEMSSALAEWNRGAGTVIGAALAVGLVIIAIVLTCVWLVGKKLREHDLHRTTALNNMAQGLCMFDAKQRLIVCNARYAQLYGLDRELTKPGTTLRQILEYCVSKGYAAQSGEEYVADRLDKVGAERAHQVVNQLGDGRFIAVAHTPMPNGGWVATHEDVTEAKFREESFRLLFDGNPVPMWVFDPERLRFLAVNDAAVAHYGYSREQFMAMSVLDIRPAADRGSFVEHLQSAHDIQTNAHITQHLRANASRIDVSIFARTMMYEGRKARLVAVHDITKIKLVETELRRTEKFLDAIIENVPAAILVKDIQNQPEDPGRWRYSLINRATEELFGVSRAQIVGKTIGDLYPKERAEFIIAENKETVQSHQPVIVNDHLVHTPGNGVRVATAKSVAVRDVDGIPQFLLTVIDDVTERRRAEQRIARMAHYDALTDLPNRAAFNECFAATLERAGTNEESFSILSVDLDHFKEVNDLCGHAVGDALLREATRRMQKVAAGAFLARIGGDEFMLIVTEGAQPEGAVAVAERLLGAFADDFTIDNRQLHIGLTIGGAVYPADGADANTLMVNADTALYRAKAECRGTALFFAAEMSARAHERLALQADLRQAVARGELELHYQPQVRMTGETIGFEALLRWRCAKRGVVSPGLFIPIAEESGLIGSIGEWVLREACREAASWSNPLSVAVNVSPLQFQSGDLPGLVHSILLETGLNPARLELEITENVLINDFSRAVSILRRLKALGIQIAVDDFGTGYSSLSYLHAFDFDRIKIDRAFIGDLDRNRHSMIIVRAVIGLGHSLDVPVLAEGVETEIQHAMLVQEGCDAMQGYLTGKPLPIGEYASLLGSEEMPMMRYATAH